MRRLRKAVLWTAGVLVAGRVAAAQQYDSGDPTADEQHVLEMINRARANPWAEGSRLQAQGLPDGNIAEGLVAPDNRIGVRPPLAMNKILLGTARAHNLDMYSNSFFGHNSSGGKTPGERLTAAGYVWQKEGENIAAASGPGGRVNATAAELEDALMVDAGIADRGHRLNLLDAYGPPLDFPVFREIGVGYLHQNVPDSAGMTDLVTQDFGTSQTRPGPFLLGVMFTDANGNNLYDAGEGVSGITVNIAGAAGPLTAFAVSASAGGYVIPIPGVGGNLTVTISGGPLSSAFSTVVATTGENVKVDFIIQGSTATVAPSPSGSAGAGASPGKDHHRCGVTGFEAAALLVLLAALRRRRSPP